MNERGIKSVLYQWLSSQLGTPNVFKISFDADFITGNFIDATLGGDAIDQVAFDTDHQKTLKKLASNIQKKTSIFKAVVTGAREITCTGSVNGVLVSVVGPTVTGGASQAVATITQITAPQSVQVIFADQNGEKPRWPFAWVRIDTFVKNGFDELREIDEDGIATLGGQRRATVSVHFYGQNAFEELSKAYNSLEKNTVIDLFSAGDLSILDKFSVNNLSAMLETIYEPHASFDFYIGFADNYEDDLGIIERVELTSTYEDFGNDPITIGPKIIGP